VSNTNSPFGFRQYRGNGSSPTYEQITVGAGGISGGIAYNAGAIYFGDPVIRSSVGVGTLIAGVGSGSVVPIAGIFQGCKYLSTAQKRTTWSNYWPGSDVASANAGATEAYIVNDPNAVWVAQTDSTGFAITDIGSNVDYAIGSGTAANGISGAYLLHGGATTSTFAFRFVDLLWAPPGQNGVATVGTAAAYNYAIVAFNSVETKALLAYNT
jgi:hypothetical protein